jgi:serine/threonine protein kinase
MPLQNGEAFAGYVIQRFLGSGAMGEVYLAQHPRLPRLDALKVLSAALTAEAGFRHRFNREADLAASLWHQHIVGIHDRGEFNGRLWISMDYVDGTDASRLLQEMYPTGMPVPEVVEIVTAVADALDFAHQRHLLHRDVKPSNILLTESQSGRRRVLLSDFGIARQADEVSGLTGTNMTVGSVGYAAPEQLMGQEIDGRADQYGLAATAYHLLTGTLPFQHSNPAVVISKQLTNPAPWLSEMRPALANLDQVLSVALAKDPNQRYSRCLELAEAMRRESALQYSRPAAVPPDATRALSIPRPGPDTAVGETRALSLPPRPNSDSDQTRVHSKVSVAPADATRAIKMPASTPRFTAEAPGPVGVVPSPRQADAEATAQINPPRRREPRKGGQAVEPVSDRRHGLTAGHDVQSTGASEGASLPAPPPPQRSAGDHKPRKARWIALASLLLSVVASIAAALAYWKFTATKPPTADTPAVSVPAIHRDVAVRTKSGRTICLIASNTVRCEAKFTHSPVQRSVPHDGLSDVSVDSQGHLTWGRATMGTPPRIMPLDYATYNLLGWTVVASNDGTRFTKDRTGHGMFVSIDTVSGL